jgi:hypothetical protein
MPVALEEPPQWMPLFRGCIPGGEMRKRKKIKRKE